MILAVGALGAAGCATGPTSPATESASAEASPSAVVDPAPTVEPVGDAAAFVAVVQGEIAPGVLPDQMYLAEETTQPGSTAITWVYATATYGGGGDIGPVVAVGARPLSETDRTLVDGTRPGAVPLPDVAPGAELVTTDAGSSILVDDGTTLVQLVATNYDAEHLVAFAESIADSIGS